MFGYIIGTLHRMVNAGITKIVVNTIISACDIVFSFNLLPGGFNIIQVAANLSAMARCDDLLLILFSVHVITTFMVRDDCVISQLFAS